MGATSRIACALAGLGMALVGTALAPQQEPPGGRALAPEEARAAFERLASLAGSWRGESTAGWKDEVVFEVIAGGSVVMQTSRFEAHPGDTMVTMYHLDQGRLMLTHYCVAGNQPRLVASASADGGREVTFRFRDGTNLGSRDEGHMDRVVYHFEGPDAYRSQWSWYQEGEERWMEEIRLERVPRGAR